MPDNVGYTPGSGATIAADEIGTALYQRMKLIYGDDGVNAGDVSINNGLPVQGVGELIEVIESLRMTVQALTRSTGLLTPDVSGRLRVLIDSISASLTLATVSTVGVVSNIAAGTLTALNNQTQMGGYSANDQIPSLMQMRADVLRGNITVT
ncbi:MAG: hypothetical protein EBR82_30575 [Caulobacteraceae bacterium]|nr:hypothetical protein [Caulobacteraceae bacterium]